MGTFMPLHFIFQILCGIVVGWLAGLVVQGNGSGLLLNLIIGVLGSVLGNTIVSLFHIHVIDGFLGVLAVSVGGAVILLILLRILKNN